MILSVRYPHHFDVKCSVDIFVFFSNLRCDDYDDDDDDDDDKILM